MGLDALGHLEFLLARQAYALAALAKAFERIAAVAETPDVAPTSGPT